MYEDIYFYSSLQRTAMNVSFCQLKVTHMIGRGRGGFKGVRRGGWKRGGGGFERCSDGIYLHNTCIDI